MEAKSKPSKIPEPNLTPTPPPQKKNIPLLNFAACELTTEKGIPFNDKCRCVMNTMAKFSIKWVHVRTTSEV